MTGGTDLLYPRGHAKIIDIFGREKSEINFGKNSTLNPIFNDNSQVNRHK